MSGYHPFATLPRPVSMGRPMPSFVPVERVRPETRVKSVVSASSGGAEPAPQKDEARGDLVLALARSPDRLYRRAATVSARIAALRAAVRVGGPLPWGPLQAASAHEAGLTLDEIDEIYAVPPAEAARAIALHAGR